MTTKRTEWVYCNIGRTEQYDKSRKERGEVCYGHEQGMFPFLPFNGWSPVKHLESFVAYSVSWSLSMHPTVTIFVDGTHLH